MVRHIPNFLTACNILCGGLGIIAVMEGSYPAAWFVWAACVFDFFDGFSARLLKVSSPIGKELDSLADMVSFGALPAIFMYKSLVTAGAGWMAFVALLLLVFSGLRLAKFNIDDSQTDSFIGLPTPANAIFITSLVFLPESVAVMQNPYVLVAISVVFSYLLVAPIKLMALKFSHYRWKGNQKRFTLLVLAALFILMVKAGALPF